MQLLGFKSDDMKVNCWGPKSRLRTEVPSSQQASGSISSSDAFITMLSDQGSLRSFLFSQFSRIHVDECVIKSFAWLKWISGRGWPVVTHLTRKSPSVTNLESWVAGPGRLRTPGVSQVLEVDSKPWLASALFVSVSGWQPALRCRADTKIGIRSETRPAGETDEWDSRRGATVASTGQDCLALQNTLPPSCSSLRQPRLSAANVWLVGSGKVSANFKF